MNELKKKRRVFGEHLTSTKIFKEFILPEIRNEVYNFTWVDLYGGAGNLILPILSLIPLEKRINFFKEHIFLFDIQKRLVQQAIKKAERYGIPEEIAKQNIKMQDTIENYPKFLLKRPYPIYHITNPPYLYIGYIAKHQETTNLIKYFQGANKGYQDLYQLALINDLRHKIRRMIYIIPSNFLFGASVSNKIREDFLPYYNITKAIIFEKRIFKFTGTNVIICFFKRKNTPSKEPIKFEGLKISDGVKKRTYVLSPQNKFRAGNEFELFVKANKTVNPLKVSFYLTQEQVLSNPGPYKLKIVDANNFNGKTYNKTYIQVNKKLRQYIKSNVLFIRTVDTGSINGRAGLYTVQESFQADGILVTKAKYRTHPIQIFITPNLPVEQQLLLKDYFNLLLEYFRKRTDSEFMTTYKYSNSEYTRKYLGLSQSRKLIETFPILSATPSELDVLKQLVHSQRAEKIIELLNEINQLNRKII